MGSEQVDNDYNRQGETTNNCLHSKCPHHHTGRQSQFIIFSLVEKYHAARYSDAIDQKRGCMLAIVECYRQCRSPQTINSTLTDTRTSTGGLLIGCEECDTRSRWRPRSIFVAELERRLWAVWGSSSWRVRDVVEAVLTLVLLGLSVQSLWST